MLKLYDFQEELLQDARCSLAQQTPAEGEGPTVLLQLATGGGKTVVATQAVKNCLEKGKTAGFICHRRELIDQTAGTFTQADVDFGYIAAGYPKSAAKVQIASLSTLVKRAHLIEPPDLVIWDECQHLAAKSWAKVFNLWRSATHIGLSATPQRLDGAGLGKYFADMVQGPTVAELMERGFLSTYRCFMPVVADFSQVGKRAGEYKVDEVASILESGEVIADIVKHWKRICPGKKTIGFAPTCRVSEQLAAAFTAAGVPSVHLDGTTPTAQRVQALRDFARGRYQVVWNVGLFDEGFDLQANAGIPCTVEAVILAAHTASVARHLQRMGRALRRKPEPAVILDCTGNCLVPGLGLPDEPREWSLEGRDKKAKAKATIRRCGECFMAVPIRCVVCPHCGTAMPFNEREQKEVHGELVEIDTGMVLRLEAAGRKREEREATTLEQLQEIGRRRGYKSGWAQIMYDLKQRGQQGRYRPRRARAR